MRNMNGELVVRKWDGEDWPEKRISIADKFSGHAIMISPRYVDIDHAEESARHIVSCVNYHNLLKETLRRLCAACENLEYEAGRVDLPLQDAENLLNLLEQLEQTHD